MFQKISWSAQLAAGLILFGVSFLLEALVLTAYFGTPLLGFAVAGGLEAGKVLAIVLYRILREHAAADYPPGVRWAAVAFRTALFLLSAVCSVMFLAEQLDRPHLEAVRAADLAQAETEYGRALDAAREDQRQRAAKAGEGIAAEARRRSRALAEIHEPAIASLEAGLVREMENVVGGRFKGPRYREIEARLAREKDAYARERAEIDRVLSVERGKLEQRLSAERSAELRDLTARRDARVAAIRTESYGGDHRAEHPTAHAFVGVLAAVFGLRPDTLQFVFYFSLFLSLTIELGIVVAFEHITLARLPVFMAEHRSELDLQRKAVETDTELRRFELDDEVAQAKVRRRRRSIEEVLRGDDEKLAGNGPPVRNAVQ